MHEPCNYSTHYGTTPPTVVTVTWRVDDTFAGDAPEYPCCLICVHRAIRDGRATDYVTDVVVDVLPVPADDPGVLALSRHWHRERLAARGRARTEAVPLEYGGPERMVAKARYRAAADLAPASRWWLVADDTLLGCEEPPDDEVALAGPFDTEDAANAWCEEHGREDGAIVPRRPDMPLPLAEAVTA